MVNFRDAVPPTNPADMAVLAARMNLYRPVSLRKLIGDLGPPTAVMFSSGNISTSIAGGNVAGSATGHSEFARLLELPGKHQQ